MKLSRPRVRTDHADEIPQDPRAQLQLIVSLATAGDSAGCAGRSARDHGQGHVAAEAWRLLSRNQCKYATLGGGALGRSKSHCSISPDPARSAPANMPCCCEQRGHTRECARRTGSRSRVKPCDSPRVVSASRPRAAVRGRDRTRPRRKSSAALRRWPTDARAASAARANCAGSAARASTSTQTLERAIEAYPARDSSCDWSPPICCATPATRRRALDVVRGRTRGSRRIPPHSSLRSACC